MESDSPMDTSPPRCAVKIWAGLMTGRYQQRFGHEANSSPSDGMDLKQLTMADRLKNWDTDRTNRKMASWQPGQILSNSKRFDYFSGYVRFKELFLFKKMTRQAMQRRLKGMKQVKFDGYLTDVFGQKAIDFINERWQTFLSLSLLHGSSWTDAPPRKIKLLASIKIPRGIMWWFGQWTGQSETCRP